MTYEEVEDFLFNQLPIYQKQGLKALNRSLDKTISLLDGIGNPERKFKSVHVGGTNGKGSSSHMLASILHEEGYKVGLHTSPHLKNYTERIKVNGAEVSKEFIRLFIERHKSIIDKLEPSFFEITVAIAFQYFADEKVDIAIVEVGMGGTYDSTNVLKPEVCLITNIGWDHQHILGDTLEKIAREKAGIIKKDIPVVLGPSLKDFLYVFEEKAKTVGAKVVLTKKTELEYDLDLKGNYQRENANGVIQVILQLQELGWNITEKSIIEGLKNVILNTGLKGRWQILNDNPMMICDTGHNINGVELIVDQLQEMKYDELHMIFGMVSDKDSEKVLSKLPKDGKYYVVEPKIPRAKLADELLEEMIGLKLSAQIISKDVNETIQEVQKKAHRNDLIFIGGSTFVVAEIEDL